MNKEIRENVPFYVKSTLILVGLIGLFFTLWVAQSIIIPIVFSLLMAILLDSVVTFLTRKKVNRVVAIVLSLVLGLSLVAGLFIFIGMQINSFSEGLPDLQEKFNSLFKDITDWASQTFNVSSDRIHSFVNKKKSEGMGNSNAMIGSTVNTVSHFFVLLLIIPVYIFLMLFYKALLLKFIAKLLPVEKYGLAQDVLTETRSLIQQYLLGLLIEMAIVAALTAIGLAIIGIESPILFGVMTALLNTVPYVGVLIANLLVATVALVTKSPSSALIVVATMAFIQFIDNNLIIPKIVGSKVKINALATIVAVLVGGELCGVAGMFLAIPVTAVLKVIFDRISALEPVGFLLGDELPSSKRNVFSRRRAEPIEENKDKNKEENKDKKEKKD